MPLLRQGEVRLQSYGFLRGNDFDPPKRPGEIMRLTDFELWGYWVQAITRTPISTQIASTLQEIKPWFGVMEVEG